ncbi:membrane protein implicated in regulation of membrane protease activity [Mumia flava]|uniref:Membrane protein implicated in regulation of membrane protease activity n=1 Tax=Mumia flava TaxID=1348852 RepID=A0A0B2B8I2_9ACTN|nr:NfeD family protein [Mumia flava]PJJ53552.1 membrane protein implicated in regulation of membrane protease activity [Mumia flava]
MSGIWDWFAENAWAAWTALGLFLLVVEMLSLDLVFLMLAFGAFAGGVTSAVGGGLVLSVLVAVVVAFGMLWLARPSMLRRLHSGPDLRSGVAALVGQSAVVVEAIDRDHGQVKLDGEIWSARSFDPHRPIASGARVSVLEIDGATAVVFPED